MKFSLLTLTIGISMALLDSVHGCPAGDTTNKPFAYTIDDLNLAMPMKMPDTSCDKAVAGSGCVTNKVTLPFLQEAMAYFKITTRGEAVGLLALMMYESLNFTQWQNTKVAGQGTYNMQHFYYNYQYLKEMNKGAFDSIAKSYPVDDPEKLQQKQYSTTTPLTKQESDTMGAYLIGIFFEKLQFASAFWFLNTIAPDYKTKLATGGLAGFEDYVKNGVGVETYKKERSSYWTFVDSVVHK